MADEVTETTETTEETTPVALVDAEGNLSENWKDSLPEELRGEKCLDLVTTFQGGISQLVNAQKAIGKNKVVLPNENSPDSEWEQFYDATGRPKTSKDYPFAWPDDIPEDLRNDEQIDKYREVAFANGCSPKLWNAFIEAYNQDIKTALELAEQQDTSELETAEETLKKKWGMAYEERIHVADRLINETTEEGEQREKFIAEFGRNPIFVEWAAEVGKKLIAHKALIAEVTQSTPKEAEKQIEELQATPGYLNGELKQSNPAKHERIRKELEELYKAAYPDKKAAG